MPEGDTIFRAARTLHRALAGKIVLRFESVFPALTRVDEDQPIAGRTIEKVESAGKHVLMHFSADQRDPGQRRMVLRTHMRMSGSWHIYRPGERWQRPRRDMRLLVATADFEAVGFNIHVAEFIEESRLSKHAELARLGPDLLNRTFDRDEAVRRLQSRGTMAIADALLVQRVMAGIGNVYKSEVLFICRIDPFATVASLDANALASLVDTARKLLEANVTGRLEPMTTYAGQRRTTRLSSPSERLWVYGRAGLPCRRCGTAIAIRKQGADARLTYWCPTCQTS